MNPINPDCFKKTLAENASLKESNLKMRMLLVLALQEMESHGLIEENYETLGDLPIVKLHKAIKEELSKTPFSQLVEEYQHFINHNENVAAQAASAMLEDLLRNH